MSFHPQFISFTHSFPSPSQKNTIVLPSWRSSRATSCQNIYSRATSLACSAGSRTSRRTSRQHTGPIGLASSSAPCSLPPGAGRHPANLYCHLLRLQYLFWDKVFGTGYDRFNTKAARIFRVKCNPSVRSSPIPWTVCELSKPPGRPRNCRGVRPTRVKMPILVT